MFAEKKTSAKGELSRAITQTHIIFDLWNSTNQLAFISIFGHFLDEKLVYRSRLLAFRRQVGPHAGENIACNADTEARKMRCFGHILSLVAQSFLFGEDAASFELQSGAYGMLEQAKLNLEHWQKKDPVGKFRNIAKFIRASPQRTEAFKAHARA
jgi:hypothetical protein